MIKKIFSYKISTATFFSLIISFIYFLIVVIISGKHEFWGDEINTWLAVRDMAKPELLKFMLWDGHPILHYMVFSIFADLGLTLHSVQLFFCLISAAGIFILYRFCSFPLWIKTIITFSPAMLYYYPIMLRNYVYIPPLIFSLISIFPYALRGRFLSSDLTENSFACTERKQKILFAIFCLLTVILSATHAVMLPFSAGIFAILLFYFIKKKDSIPVSSFEITALAISGLIIAATALQLIICRGNNPMLGSFPANNFVQFMKLAASFFTNHASDFVSVPTPGKFILDAGIIAVLILFASASVYLIRTNLTAAFIFLFSLFGYLFIFFSSYSIIFPYRTYSMLFVLAAALHISSYLNKNSHHINVGLVSLSLLFLIGYPSGFAMLAEDFKKPFSTGKDMADYINRNIPENDNTILITSYPNSVITVAYHLGERKILMGCKQRAFVMNWSEKYENDFSCFEDSAKTFYFVFPYTYEIYPELTVGGRKFHLEYYSKPAVKFQENFALYKMD